MELNQRDHALLVCKTLFEALLMSRLVNDRVLVEYASPDKLNIPASVDDVFVIDDNGKLANAIFEEGEWQTDQFTKQTWKLTRQRR